MELGAAKNHKNEPTRHLKGSNGLKVSKTFLFQNCLFNIKLITLRLYIIIAFFFLFDRKLLASFYKFEKKKLPLKLYYNEYHIK